jgi:hypothetical protein
VRIPREKVTFSVCVVVCVWLCVCVCGVGWGVGEVWCGLGGVRLCVWLGGGGVVQGGRNHTPRQAHTRPKVGATTL